MIQVEVNLLLEQLEDISPFFYKVMKNRVKILVNLLQRSKEKLSQITYFSSFFKKIHIYE